MYPATSRSTSESPYASSARIAPARGGGPVPGRRQIGEEVGRKQEVRTGKMFAILVLGPWSPQCRMTICLGKKMSYVRVAQVIGDWHPTDHNGRKAGSLVFYLSGTHYRDNNHTFPESPFNTITTRPPAADHPKV